MGKRNKSGDPMGTLAMFETVRRDGVTVAAGRFRCGMCNTLVVDEAGQVCPACTEVVTTTTTKTRTRKTSTAKKSTAGKTTSAGKSTAGKSASAGKPVGKGGA